MKNVLYVPDLAYNLLSVSKASDGDNTVEFKGDKCKITDSEDKLLATGSRIGELYFVDLEIKVENEFAYAATEPSKPSKNKIWHSRYGHLGGNNLTHRFELYVFSTFSWREGDGMMRKTQLPVASRP